MDDENIRSSSSDSPKRPVLSLILCARNDQYQGNSLWRLQTALNYVAQSVHQLGREADVEVIVADWGSETPLRNVLMLTQEAARMVSFVYIPPDIARVEQKDSPFAEVLAINAAARRANGEYIGRIDQDTLVGRYFLERFFWLHEKRRMIVPLNRAVMSSNRRRIPYRFAVRCPSFWVVDRYLRWFAGSLALMDPPPAHLQHQCYIGILLFHRDLWHQCGGYDERFIYMDFMEFDIVMRLAMQNTFVNIGEIVDYDFFHLDHSHPRKPLRFGRSRKSNPARTIDNPPDQINPNGENWGLIQYPLEVLPYPVEQVAVNEARPVRSWLAWLAFISTLFISGVQMAGDSVIPSVGRIWWIFLAPSTWKNRAQVIRETVSRQPVLSWPRLLVTRWVKRGSYQR
jgi:hypothetical protein